LGLLETNSSAATLTRQEAPLHDIQRSAGEPWCEMWPSLVRWSELRTVGVIPAQEQSCLAVWKRMTSPTSAITSIAM
jgi:hypothetical protein